MAVLLQLLLMMMLLHVLHNLNGVAAHTRQMRIINLKYWRAQHIEALGRGM
jgi:hypothetical protein